MDEKKKQNINGSQKYLKPNGSEIYSGKAYYDEVKEKGSAPVNDAMSYDIYRTKKDAFNTAADRNSDFAEQKEILSELKSSGLSKSEIADVNKNMESALYDKNNDLVASRDKIIRTHRYSASCNSAIAKVMSKADETKQHDERVSTLESKM